MKFEIEMYEPDELDAFATFIQAVAGQRRDRTNQGHNAYRDWIGERSSTFGTIINEGQIAEPLTADEQVDFPQPAEEPKKRRTRKAKTEPDTVEQPTIEGRVYDDTQAPPEPEPEETTTDMDVAPEVQQPDAVEPESVETAPIDFPSEPLDMKPLTLEDLRAAFTGIYSRAPNRTAGQEAIMAVLGKFGAKNASSVPADRLADAIAECNAQFAK